jgi:hypothetical protein
MLEFHQSERADVATVRITEEQHERMPDVLSQRKPAAELIGQGEIRNADV